MNVYLTLEQVQAAITFLQRVNLNGKEVPTYVELVNALQEARTAKESSKKK